MHPAQRSPNTEIKMTGKAAVSDQSKPGRGRPPKAQDEGKRTHISVPESMAARMEDIRKQTHASTLTEVVKNALAFYSAVVAEHQAGGQVYFKRTLDGTERQLALFI